MEYRYLGRSGLKVSALCLGTMMFGDRTDVQEAQRIVDSAREAGVNYIDTADQYAAGASERIVGQLLAADRHSWVLATKVGNPMGKGPNEVGLSRKWIMQACDASLQRLRTDYIDIYYLHLDYADIPLEEMVGSMGDLIRAGKIRYFGVSNFRGWRIAEIMHLCRATGVPKPVVCQPYYNAMNRQPEVEILPACHYYGIGVTPYSPIARGVLTGKYKPGQPPPEDSRAGRKDKRMMETEFREESLIIAQRFKEHAEGKGLTSGQFAFAWVLSNRIVDSVIGGPRTLEQWTEYYGALNYVLDREDEEFVDSLVRPGHPSTPGYNDPRYPVTGRLPRCLN
ncbi:MAG TPA: aldo/keto reductase [Burkholderiales bacterium]|jgi:aryl-alcohol dehydrogenase-like predicted oxidoreductase|nr:aldo/keto reductase [Burkholderiales bacterium]